MKIVVISDTHIPAAADRIPERIMQCVRDSDCVVHAGDATEMSVIDELRLSAVTYAVKGNMDSAEVRKNLPEKLSFKIGGKLVGVVHGHGASSAVVRAVQNAFKSKKPDIVIFGHSHIPFNEIIGKTLFFNPGSVTDRMFAPYRSFGIIEIIDGEVTAEIVKID